jgi:hypothetical protein
MLALHYSVKNAIYMLRKEYAQHYSSSYIQQGQLLGQTSAYSLGTSIVPDSTMV